MTMTPQEALLEMTLADAEAASEKFDDLLVEGINRGIPPEVMTRLSEIWEQTRIVAGHVVNIGKIIVLKIFEFLKANPHLTVGAALGAAVAVLVASAIPFLGALIAPLAAVVAGLYGAGIAAARAQGVVTDSPLQAGIALAQAFFEMLLLILDGVTEYIKS
jgi:hypothetical protein